MFFSSYFTELILLFVEVGSSVRFLFIFLLRVVFGPVFRRRRRFTQEIINHGYFRLNESLLKRRLLLDLRAAGVRAAAVVGNLTVGARAQNRRRSIGQRLR